MKKYVIFLVMIVMLPVAAAVAFATDDPLKAKVMEIEQAYISGDLTSLTAKYEALTKSTPKDAAAHYLLGVAYLYADFNKKDTTFDKSFVELSRAKDLNPKMKYVNYSMGYVFWARGQYDKAIESYKAEIAIDPNYAWNYYNLGQAYESLKQWDNALSQYIIAIDKDPNMAKAYNNLGAIYLNWRGDYFKALDNFKKAIALKPNVRLYKENYNKTIRQLRTLKDSLDKGETELPPDMVEKIKRMELKEIDIAAGSGV